MATDESTSAEQPTADALPPKKKRSLAERLVVWGLIILLGIGVAMEYRGMTGYNKTLNNLETRMDESRADPNDLFLLTEVPGLSAMSPTISEPVEVNNGLRESTVSWSTLLSFLPNREYAIHLALGGKKEEPTILGITTASVRAEENRILNQQK